MKATKVPGRWAASRLTITLVIVAMALLIAFVATAYDFIFRLVTIPLRST